MRRSIWMLWLLLLASLSHAQTVRENYFDGEFFLAQEEYEEALFAYSKVYKYGYEDNASLNYRMGICLLNIPGRKAESIPYLEKAALSVSDRYKGTFKEEVAPPDALLYLGNAYRINMELEKAIEKYQEYLVYLTKNRDKLQKDYTEAQILSCQNAVKAINSPVDFSIGNLGEVKQTHPAPYNVVFSQDRKHLAYMGKNPFYNAVLYAYIQEDGTWSEPRDLSAEIVSDSNMDVVGLSAKGDLMLLAVYDEFDSNIYSSTRNEDGSWNPAVPLGKPVNSRFYESHAALSSDKKSLYFTSNNNKSLGGMDIFRSDLQPDGSWGDPVNMGEGINSPLNEDCPFLSPDGKRLYFSSQGHNTIGGYDLFYVDRNTDGSWGSPVNVGYPLNSTDDDFAFSPNGLLKYGSTLVFAKGVDTYDLFQFGLIDPEATAKPVDFSYPPVPADGILVLTAGKVDPSKHALAEKENPEKEDSGDVAGKGVSEIPEVPVQTEETAVTEKEEPLARAGEPAAPEEAKQAVEKPAPVSEASRYLIKPIFFGFESDALTAASKAKLDELYNLLEQFPALKLRIIGHTDALGSYEYNTWLSLKRAKAVSRYLIAAGIDANRLELKGESEAMPVAINKTRDERDAPEGRKLNRRVQFDVLVDLDVVIEMEKIEVPEHLKIKD